jgi:hypothetical protein
MSEAQEAIAEAAEEHRPYGLDCKCGRPINSDSDWSRHFAAEIDKALGGLTRVWGAQMIGDDEVTVGSEGTARYCAQRHPMAWKAMSRWVSGWTEVSE